MIVTHFRETLLEVTVDNFHFRITWYPIEANSCIIWFKDIHVTPTFEALGKFSHFDKRNILEFITRYSTNIKLRKEIKLRTFKRKINGLTSDFFETMDKLSDSEKKEAYRNLYNLDKEIEHHELDKKRRIMAKKFHPDAGGDHLAMSVINEAYEHLSSNT